MSRFYWMLGASIGVITTAWTVTAQPIPGAPRPGSSASFAPAFQFSGGRPPWLPFPPPASLPMTLGPAEGGLPPPWPPGPRMGPPGRPGFAEACLDMLARRAAGRAYLKARLSLTPQQVLAWEEFETAATDGDEEERQACLKAAPRPEDQSIAQRMDAAEEQLVHRLAQVRKVGAPLRKLITTLSPEQARVIEQSMPAIPF